MLLQRMSDTSADTESRGALICMVCVGVGDTRAGSLRGSFRSPRHLRDPPSVRVFVSWFVRVFPVLG